MLRLSVFLLTLFLLKVTSIVYAEYFGDFLYTNLGSEIQITSWDGLSQSIEIPQAIAGIPVKSIGDHAFSGKTIITSVTMPSSVTNIGYQAFNSSGITNIVVPSSVKKIGGYVFGGCSSLRSATLSTNISEISEAMFYGCTNLQAIQIPLSVTNIASNAFMLCSSLTNIVLPQNLQTISYRAFMRATNLKTIDLPNSLKTIDFFAFQYCSSITNIVLPNNIETIQMRAFEGCTNLETIILPSSLKLIGSGVFYNCKKLKSAILSASVIDLPNGSDFGLFENCTNLSSVTIPEGITGLPTRMFSGCSKLEYLTLPTTITNIAGGAFQGCPQLKGVYLLGNAPARTSDLFANGTTNVIVYYTQGASGWGTAFSGRPTALAGTFTLLPNYDSSKGTLQLSPNQPYYNSGTAVTVYAIPNSGYIFNSWTGGPPESISSPIAISNGIVATTTTITVNSNKTIGAIFNQDLSDSDGDTLTNFAELTTYGSNPNLADSNADGIADGKAVAFGYSPSSNFSPLISYLQSYPPAGLYTASQMQAMAIGDLVLTKNSDGSFNLNYDIEKSTDLQSWIPYQSLTLSLTNLPSDKAFIRIKAKQ